MFMIKEWLVLYSIPTLLFLLFFIAYKVVRTKLITGFMLSCSIIAFLGVFFLQAYHSDSRVLKVISVIPLLIFVFFLSFGVYIFIAFLLLNTRSILKKEERSFRHFLSAAFAIVLLLIMIIPRFIDLTSFPQIAVYFSYSAYGLIIYYLLHLTQYIVNMMLCNLSRPRKDQHYIIVLGCWIKNGEVTPLLARRIDKAIEFYNKQKKVCEPPKLVLSGGKGTDEICSEAEAMKKYALEKGVPEEHLLLEPKSVSTLENMRFSKEIMDKDSGGKSYKCIYTTNNYHVLRAGVFARKAGLKINGIGAKTAFYYFPNALLREYIAYLYIHLRWNIAFGIVSLLFGSIILPKVFERFLDYLSMYQR